MSARRLFKKLCPCGQIFWTLLITIPCDAAQLRMTTRPKNKLAMCERWWAFCGTRSYLDLRARHAEYAVFVWRPSSLAGVNWRDILSMEIWGFRSRFNELEDAVEPSAEHDDAVQQDFAGSAFGRTSQIQKGARPRRALPLKPCSRRIVAVISGVALRRYPFCPNDAVEACAAPGGACLIFHAELPPLPLRFAQGKRGGPACRRAG